MKRFHIIFTLLFVAFFAIGLTACNEAGTGKSTLGNGKVDPIEAAALRVVVGMAFTARPDTIIPAHAVSTAILATMDAGSGTGAAVPLSAIDGVIAEQTAKLHLDPASLQSFNDLVLLVKAQVAQQLGANADIAQTLVVAHDVVLVVQQTAAARLGIPTAPVVTPATPAAPATSIPATPATAG